MAENQIDLKSIQDLRGMKFFIPDYQRGYRWTKQQVEDLLDDIWEFMKNGNGGWYSLQPVVVKQRESGEKIDSFRSQLEGISAADSDAKAIEETSKLLDDFKDWKYWEVVDGQQRLTSLFIVLKYLDKNNNVFSIDYETRNVEDGNSSEFLNNIAAKTESKASDNIDYYHMFHTCKAVEKWFGEGGKNLTNESKNEFKKTILNKVQVIWYEITENAIDVFTRINSGKIPLTNAELIKALFLNSSNFKDANPENLRLKQLEIASEWDRIEYSLQDDSFWLFLNKDNDDLPTRIEFVFHLMYQLEKDKSDTDEFDKLYGNDNFSTFRFFNHKFKANSEEQNLDEIVNDTWLEIKKLYQTLEEWYENRELYHKVGYLITMGVEIIVILKEWEGKTKKQFKQWLNARISSFVKDIDLDKLEYKKSDQVRRVLLLHNIQTLLKIKNESILFPFDRFKNEKWDIEHIHANATEVKVGKDKLKEWLEKNYVETNDKQRDEKMEGLIQSILRGDTFEEDISSDIISNIISDVLGDEDNSLGNLCLLDSKTNRSYKNDGFKVKRKKIIEREKEGVFIPISTRNLFMKYYSYDVKSLELWSETDRDNYLKDIEDKLTHYLTENNQ